MIEPRELLASVGFPEPRALTRMNGQDAAVWRVDDGERSVALRVLPPGREIEGEVRAQKIALDLGMPVPTVLESGVFAQHPFTITTWLAGDPREDLATTRVILQFAPALMPAFGAASASFTGAFLDGYAGLRRLPNDDELRPFAQAAAAVQLATWSERVHTGAAEPSLARAAKDVLDFWS